MDAPVPALHLDTVGLPAAEGFRAWATMMPWFELERRDPNARFDLRADAWLLGRMVLSVTQLPAILMDRTSKLIDADGRADYAVAISDRDWTICLEHQAPVKVQAAAICVLDTGRRFHVEGFGGELTILNVPRDMLEDAKLTSDLHGLVIGDALAGIFGDFLNGLCARAPKLKVSQAPSLSQALRDLLVVCLAAGETLPAKEINEGVTVQRAGAFIDHNLSSALTVEDVAVALGVSRSRLYRIFNEVGGVKRFMRRRRLHRARELLSRPSLQNERPKIGDVALATGFVSTAHFSRHFRTQFGMTPSEARAREMIDARVSRAPESDAGRFRAWHGGRDAL